MSYQSRVYRQRNPKSGDEGKKEAFFKPQHQNKTRKNNSFFQAKLAVNEPGDSHEQQADAVADKVVHQSGGGQGLHGKGTKSVQRLATTKEEENVSSNDQRMNRDKEKPFQRKVESTEKDKEVRKKEESNHGEEEKIQKKEEPDKEKEMVQKKEGSNKDEAEKIQKKEEAPKKEEEKKAPAAIQKKPDHAIASHPSIPRFAKGSNTGKNLHPSENPGFHTSPAIQNDRFSRQSGQRQGIQLAPGTPLRKFDFPVSVGFFPNFDAIYAPDNIKPQEGTIRFAHNIFIKFDKKLPADRQEKFKTDFKTNVESLWSDKFLFEMNDSAFTSYLAHVKIEIVFVDDPKNAHTIMGVQNNPKGFRSNVETRTDKNFTGLTHVAHLDISDPSPEELAKKNKGKNVIIPTLVQQVGAFDFDSAEINAACELGIRIITKHLDNFPDGIDSDEMAFSAHIDYIGRASPEGNKWYNKQLSKRRADAVKKRVETDNHKAAKIVSNVTAEGEDKTENESIKENYRRVNVLLYPFTPFSQTKDRNQNTAAHEFGHMIAFGDEYDEAANPKFEKKIAGDKPRHYEQVKAIMGQAVADELTISQSTSMMSAGNDIKKGHYAFFLKALRDLTGKPQWNIK